MEGKISKTERCFLAVLFVSAVLSFIAVNFSAADGLLHVYFLDVGQGDAIFIQSPTGRQVLIDGGPDNKVLQELGSLMPFFDNSIDIIVLSHPHADHLRGLIEVLKSYQVGQILENEISCDTPECAEWALAKRGVRETRAQAEEEIEIGGGAKLKVLYARQPDYGASSKNAHNYMVVLKLEYGGESVLLTGDAEKNIEQILVQNPDSKAQFLKVGHHGSKTSTTSRFLVEVKPILAFLELGENNVYGFPQPDIVKRLDDFGIKYYRTDIDGTIQLVLDGRNYLIK